MKNLILATAVAASLMSFGSTNDTVDVKLLEKRIERIERVLNIGPLPTYSEFTNAVYIGIEKNHTSGYLIMEQLFGAGGTTKCPASMLRQAADTLRRAGVVKKYDVFGLKKSSKSSSQYQKDVKKYGEEEAERMRQKRIIEFINSLEPRPILSE